MKKLIAYIVLAFLTASLTLAQDKTTPPSGPLNSDAPLFRQLKLTDEQKKDIEKLRFDMQKKAIEQQAKIRTARLELGQLFRADNLDQAAIQKKASELSQLQSQQLAVRIDHWFGVNKLLAPDQQKIWKRISARFLMQRRGNMRGGRTAQFQRNMRNRMHMQRSPGGQRMGMQQAPGDQSGG